MSTGRTYWIDLTDLYLWAGYHTGIQRTVYNIAKFYAQRDDAKFFIYNQRQREFYELGFEAIAIPKKRARPSRRRSELRDQLKFRLKTIYFVLPRPVRKRLTPVLKPVARQAYHKTHHTLYFVRRSLATPRRHKPLNPAIFKPEDAIIILGAGWVRPTITTDLWRRKQAVGFRIFHFIHDMIPTYHPHLFVPDHFELSTRYMFEAVSLSDGLITNSKASRRDLEQFMADLNIPPRPVTIIRLGDELLDLAEPKQPDVPIEPGEYLFTVATFEPRKNHILLYTTYKLAAARGIKLPKLVLVGQAAWHADNVLYAMANDPEVSNSIIKLKDTDNAELVWLFQNCKFAIYPAIYEGWGLPHAEALVFGKLSLTSSTSSLPEVAGDLVEYFQPFDADECLRVITKYLDPKVLAAAEARIKAEYKPQSWQASYEEFDRAVTDQLAAL